jgi:hypothetical protein
MEAIASVHFPKQFFNGQPSTYLSIVFCKKSEVFYKLHSLHSNVYRVAALPKLSHSGYSFFQVFVVLHCCIATKSHRPVPPTGNNFFYFLVIIFLEAMYFIRYIISVVL